ncbi:MAG: cyclic nucleotide-binding domain-containing protein [Desulfosporosinus sp.]
MGNLEDVFEKLAFFKGLNTEDRSFLLPFCKFRIVEAGEVVLEQDREASDFYILVSGKAEAILDYGSAKSVTLGEILPEGHFGEMSILTGDLTSASIVTICQSELLVISKEGLTKILTLVPSLGQEVIKTLSIRLKRTNVGFWEATNTQLALSSLQIENVTINDLIGKTKGIKELRTNIPKLARTNEPLCILGERGIGKELIARIIHNCKPDKNRPLIIVECSKLQEQDHEEKFFGQFGFLQLAKKGTLVLKDFEVLKIDLINMILVYINQPYVNIKLLAIVEGSTGISDKVKITHLTIPPLRNRKKDLPLLFDYFINKIALQHGIPQPKLSTEATASLMSYDYLLGNVRELEEILQRAVSLTENGIIYNEQIFFGKIGAESGYGYNLLQLPTIVKIIKKGLFPDAVQKLVFVAFIYIVLASLTGLKIFGVAPEMLVWSLWWPLLTISIALGGRIFCSVCPISFTAKLFQKIKMFSRPVPNIVKKFDFVIITFLFVLVFWFEEVTHIRTSPTITGLLLVCILSGAVITSIIFQRQTWCRHICPLGGMIALCSIAAPLELRSNTEICLNKCSTFSCYKGTEETEGCPLFQHVPYIDNNQVCKLCLKCVRNCPNDSVRLNLRFPGREILSTLRVNRGLTVFAVVLLATVGLLTIFDSIDYMDPKTWFIWFTTLYWGVAIVFSLVTWLLIKNKMKAENSIFLFRKIFSIIPIILALLIVYQAKFLPIIPSLDIELFTFSGQKEIIMRFSLLKALSLIVLIFGFATSAIIFIKVSRASSTKTKSTEKVFVESGLKMSAK